MIATKAKVISDHESENEISPHIFSFFSSPEPSIWPNMAKNLNQHSSGEQETSAFLMWQL
jgi:hypothetical protein